MENTFDRLTIDNINGGAIVDLFGEEWSRVVADIADVNKPAEQARKITIEVSVKPDETRGRAEIVVATKVKLPPAIGTKGLAFFSLEGGGIESYVSNPKQANLFDDENVIRMKKEHENG